MPKLSTPSKRIALFITGALVLLIATLIIRALTFSAPQPAPSTEPLPEPDKQAPHRLAEAIRFKTVSTKDPAKTPAEAFEGLHSFMRFAFPKTHGTLKQEVIAAHSLVYTWTGSDPTLKPIILAAHMDVVPVEPKTLDQWVVPPFDGAIKDGFIWGRGALDDKVSVFGILEAVELLIAQNYTPKRTIILAFGHDEEVSGHGGALKVAEHLKAQNIQAEFALDEGHAIVKGIIPGVKEPVALIGLSEKGSMSVELLVKSEGGHSSMPPKHTAAGILARAITKVEEHQVTASIDGPVKEMFLTVGPHMNFVNKLAMANLWLLEPLVISQLEAKPTTNATLRTTTAVTRLEGSEQDNILPQRARAIVNFRIKPGESMDSVLAHVRAVIEDERVEIKPAEGFNSNPSPISSSQSRGFKAIQSAVRQVWPTTITSPASSIAATDGRHYAAVAKDVYRFAPIILGPEDTVRLHGLNERIAVEDYLDAIRFYLALIKASASA